jgi:hypothetical protein
LHLAANEKAGGLFNIGSGKARTWLTWRARFSPR